MRLQQWSAVVLFCSSVGEEERLSFASERRFNVGICRYDLTDFKWRVIEPLLPHKPGGLPRVHDRRVLHGIF